MNIAVKQLLASAACLSLPLFAAAQSTTPSSPGAGQPTPAPQVPAARGPELALALEAAQAALDECTRRGQKAGVTIVDSAGINKVVLAADGTSPRGVNS